MSRKVLGYATCTDLHSYPSPKNHPNPKCLAWVSCNLAGRRYITFLKLLKLQVNEFCQRTTSNSEETICQKLHEALNVRDSGNLIADNLNEFL